MVDWDNPGQTENVYDNFDQDTNLKDESTFYNSEIPTITQDDALSKYLEDDIEQGEPVSAPEENIEQPKQYPPFDSNFLAMRWAKHNMKSVRISYITKKGIHLVRDVEPHGDFWARTTLKRILVTWDETVGDIRAFRMENIQSYQFLGKKFQPKFNFSQRQSNYRRRLRRREDTKDRGIL